jgi:ABC-type Zn uptake system ZnuABC Zn-binding protein ZnuA
MSRADGGWRRVAAGGVALLAAGVGLAVGVAGCGGPADDGWPADKPGPKVVVSFAPLYSFAVNVAGDDAVVRLLPAAGGGPHHFQPTDRDANLLRRADLFLVNGLGLEGDKPQRIKKASGNANLKVAELGGRVPEKCLREGVCHHDHGAGDDHHDHGTDPHVWLGPDTAAFLVDAIRDELTAADPAHAEGYKRRAAEYVAKLRALKADGLERLKDKKDRRLVTFHDSMAYFAHDFNLDVVGVVQQVPGTEPNDKHLKRLIALCSGSPPVRVICAEPQYATSGAGKELVKTLKHKGVDDAVLVQLDPLETATAEQLTAAWYEERMRANLDALAGAMR